MVKVLAPVGEVEGVIPVMVGARIEREAAFDEAVPTWTVIEAEAAPVRDDDGMMAWSRVEEMKVVLRLRGVEPVVRTTVEPAMKLVPDTVRVWPGLPADTVVGLMLEIDTEPMLKGCALVEAVEPLVTPT